VTPRPGPRPLDFDAAARGHYALDLAITVDSVPRAAASSPISMKASAELGRPTSMRIGAALVRRARSTASAELPVSRLGVLC